MATESRTRRATIKRTAFILLMLVMLAITGLMFWRLFTTRIVIDATAKTGERIFVTQSFGDGDFWYNTRITTCDTNGVWRWYYYDHEDDLWFFSGVRHEEIGEDALLRSGEVAVRWRPETHQVWRRHGDWEIGMIITNVPPLIRNRVD
jgi:hypothetical protein